MLKTFIDDCLINIILQCLDELFNRKFNCLLTHISQAKNTKQIGKENIGVAKRMKTSTVSTPVMETESDLAYDSFEHSIDFENKHASNEKELKFNEY